MTNLNSQISKLRIIGGKWRGRKISFAPASGVALRPTPNRVKETIFNWLTPFIVNAHCLDAFAGSGSLGFEALSRGAKLVVMVDKSAEIIKILKQNAAILSATNIEFYCGSFPEILTGKTSIPFDIVFLDPPFNHDLIEPCAHWLEQHDCLSAEAYISIEAEYPLDPAKFPVNWQIIRNKKAGAVYYHLIKRIKAK